MMPRATPGYWIAERCLELAAQPRADAEDALVQRIAALGGVKHCELRGATLHVEYDLRDIDRRAIVAELGADGIYLAYNRWSKLAAALLDYRERIRRQEQSIEYGWDAWIREIYVSRYRKRRHGRRDDRLTNWRHYIDPDAHGDGRAED